jgi:hypothetical protein
VELDPVPELELVNQAVRRNRPRFGQVADYLGVVILVELKITAKVVSRWASREGGSASTAKTSSPP